jgi:hypothetical protein
MNHKIFMFACNTCKADADAIEKAPGKCTTNKILYLKQQSVEILHKFIHMIGINTTPDTILTPLLIERISVRY